MPKLTFTTLLLTATLLILVIVNIPAIDFATLTLADALRTFLSASLTAAVLSFVLTFSRWSGYRAIVMTFVLYWGVSHFNTLNEAIFFDLDLGGGQGVMAMALSSFLSVALVSVGLVVLAGRWEEGAAGAEGEHMEARTALSWTWRFLVAAFCYYIFYFIAGIIIFPFVKEYYADKSLPGLGQVFLMQIFRGGVYAAIGILMMRVMVTSRKVTALTFGAALSILGGIAPLLPPNPIMPEDIRMVHMAEIGISNFLVGILMVRIQGGKRDRAKDVNRQS